MTPAHRGIAYAVFEDLQLADYGNHIPSLTFEVVADSGDVSLSAIAAELSRGAIEAEGNDGPVIGGYAAGGNSITDSLSPLVDGLGLAVRTDVAGMRLYAGRESEANIAVDMRGSAFNGKAEQGLRLTRGRAEEVPVRFNIRYYDASRDYQAGVQTSERPGPGRKESNLDLPAVFYADAVRSLAEARLRSLWSGRNAMELRCDWRALTLEPGAVVTVAEQAGRWRIEQSEWEGMGVRLKMRQIGGAGVAAPTAEAGQGVIQVDGAHGATTLVIADLPLPGDDLPSAPIVVAAAAGMEPGWRSAEIFVEDAATGGLTSLGGTAAPATMGSVRIVPASTVSPLLRDDVSAVEVDLLCEEMTLENADDAALFGGANHALIGREVIQFGAATQIGSSRWRLETLLRGRRGTEWAMAAHTVDEQFLLLEEESLLRIPSAYAHIGAALTLDAIGIGDLSPFQASETVTGQALLPLSPVCLSAANIGGDWHFDWIRRSREGWRWSDGVDAPLGEEQERYRISLVRAGTYFRTVETTSSQWIYDAAVIADDIAAGISGAVEIEVRQIGTYGAGRAAVAGFAI